jgi:hypothetical protein
MAEEKKTEETKSPLPTDGFVKPKVKQAVIDSEDLKAPPAAQASEPKGFRVKVAGLRGQYLGIRFNDDCIAEEVDEGHLSALKGHFGEGAVEILPVKE